MPAQSDCEARQRKWLATLNNPTDEERDFILHLEGNEVVADEEVGEEGTPHIHCYVHFSAVKRLSQLKKLLPRAHWDPVRNATEARNYCRKGKVIRNQTDQTSENSALQRSSRTRRLVQIVREKGIRAARDEDPYLFHLHRKLLLEVWSYDQESSNYDAPSVFWVYGETGTGKTRYVQEAERGNLSFLLCKSPMWFDSYKQWNEAVVFDDFRADCCELHVLLQLLDRYPIDVPIKGGFVAWRPKRIYITAPYHPRDAYRNVQEENIKQLLRRITKVIRVVSFNARTSTLPSLESDAVIAFSPQEGWVVRGNNATPERFPLPSGIPLLPELPQVEFSYHSTQTESEQTE